MLKFIDRDSGLEIDSCPECFGLWFDREELKLFFESPTLSKRILEEGASSPTLGSERSTIATGDSSNRSCPVCGEALFATTLGQTQADYCLGCQGIWLDAREIEGLVEAFQSGARGNLLLINQLIEGLGTANRPNPRAADFLSALARYRGHYGEPEI